MLLIFMWSILSCAFAATTPTPTPTTGYDETTGMPSSNSDGCLGANDRSMSEDSFKKLSADYLSSCIALLGKDKIGERQASLIWNRLLEVNGGAPEFVPEMMIRHLGWITVGIPASHMANLTMTDVDTITALGAFRNLTEAQLSGLAQAFTDQWPSKEPQDWTDIDLAMLGHILCGFNGSDLLQVHADAYMMAALDGRLSNLRGCNNDSMEALAQLALSADAFGDPHSWDAAQVRAVGCVLSGLPTDLLSQIPASSMSGLSAESVRCLPQRVTSSMTSDQLSGLSSSAAAALGGNSAPQKESGSLLEEDLAKNEAFHLLLNLMYGVFVIFWGMFLWVAYENGPVM